MDQVSSKSTADNFTVGLDKLTVSRELLRQVVDDLMAIHPGNMTPMAEEVWLKSTRALIAALEQPVQEPVAWMWKDGTTTSDPDRADGTWLPLYAAPQAQQPQLLTNEELRQIRKAKQGHDEFARAIERSVLRKNGVVK